MEIGVTDCNFELYFWLLLRSTLLLAWNFKSTEGVRVRIREARTPPLSRASLALKDCVLLSGGNLSDVKINFAI